MNPGFTSTSQYLAQHARQRPDAVALIREDVRVTYRQLADLVVQYTKALQDIPIASGMLVGIECQNRLTHLLLMWACANLGAPTVSLVRAELGPDNRIVRRCDFVFTAAPELPAGSRGQVITQQWLTGIQGGQVHPQDWSLLDTPPNPQGLARILRTSGTSGRPKAIVLTQDVVHHRGIDQVGSDPSEKIPAAPKFIAFYDLTVEFAINRLFKNLWMGGMTIFSGPQTFFQDITKHDANYTMLLVVDAERMIAQMPASFAKPKIFALSTLGTILTSRLRETILQKLASHVVNIYGSNEVGRVCVVDAEGVGTVLPGVNVAIVDEHDREKPHGEVGLIKLKSGAMFKGYLDDPALTAATLKDGWFHSSDFGTMPAADKLVVLGRADDMLNLGGIKVAPGMIEDELKSIAGVRDAAIVAVLGAGIATPAVAVETDGSADAERLKAAITQIMRPRFGRFHLMMAEALPRTDNGKVRRRVLEELFRRELTPKAAD